LEVAQIKEYLVNEKKHILITVNVYSSFYEAKYRNGLMPKDPYGTFFGGHAMTIVGYDGDLLKVLNSWGDSFGDKGYVYIDINSSIIRIMGIGRCKNNQTYIHNFISCSSSRCKIKI
jgi:C1A family cysteine protease